MRLLKIAGVATAILGVVALIITLAPAIAGQVGISKSPRARTLLGVWAQGARIGVTIRDVDETDVKREKLGTAAGVLVEEVRSDSPAERAGLKAGDILVDFDGEKVRSARQFARLVDETPEGKSVTLGVLRDGQRVALNISPEFDAARRREWIGPETLARMDDFHFEVPPIPPIEVPGFEVHTLGRSGRLGVRVETLTPQLADYFGTKEGVLVTTVDEDSPAAKAGLKAGDVITALNGRPIEDSGDLHRTLRRRDGDELSIEIVRDRKAQTLKGKLEAPSPARPLRRRSTDF
jgi:serine protease Do